MSKTLWVLIIVTNLGFLWLALHYGPEQEARASIGWLFAAWDGWDFLAWFGHTTLQKIRRENEEYWRKINAENSQG